MVQKLMSTIVQPKLAQIAFALTLLFMLVPISASAFSSPASSAQTAVPQTFGLSAKNCTKSFFGLEPWYAYLPDGYFDGSSSSNRCDLKCFNLLQQDKPNDCNRSASDLPLVLLAIVDDLLRITGMVAVAFVIYGSIKYTTSQGNPDATSEAQTTVVNALLGMAIAMISVLIVSFIGNALT
jgi:hypothetical protein